MAAVDLDHDNVHHDNVEAKSNEKAYDITQYTGTAMCHYLIVCLRETKCSKAMPFLDKCFCLAKQRIERPTTASSPVYQIIDTFTPAIP